MEVSGERRMRREGDGGEWRERMRREGDGGEGRERKVEGEGSHFCEF